MALASPKKDRHTRRDITAAIIKTSSNAVVEVSERFITIAGQYSIVSVYESLESAEEVSRSLLGFPICPGPPVMEMEA